MGDVQEKPLGLQAAILVFLVVASVFAVGYLVGATVTREQQAAMRVRR